MSIISDSELLTWLSTTDAKVTFIGKPVIGLTKDKRDSADIQVIYCSSRIGNTCGGACTVYDGAGETCLSAPGTECLRTTGNVEACSNAGCLAPCIEFIDCEEFLDDGFCSTPNTTSINVFT